MVRLDYQQMAQQVSLLEILHQTHAGKKDSFICSMENVKLHYKFSFGLWKIFPEFISN
jgi:hypothetical protein